MAKPVRPLIFAIIVIAATASAAYILNLLDRIVHGQLYNYGLQFSLEWANPYWNLLRILQALLVVIATATTVNAVLSVRKYRSDREPEVKIAPSPRPALQAQAPSRPVSPANRTSLQSRHPADESYDKPVTRSAEPLLVAPTPGPAPVSTPTPAPYTSDSAGTTRCSHCGKAFTQPLRMLDFQGDRPRIVNICPFCNEIITATSNQNETERDKKFSFRRKNGNNHGF